MITFMTAAFMIAAGAAGSAAEAQSPSRRGSDEQRVAAFRSASIDALGAQVHKSDDPMEPVVTYSTLPLLVEKRAKYDVFLVAGQERRTNTIAYGLIGRLDGDEGSPRIASVTIVSRTGPQYVELSEQRVLDSGCILGICTWRTG